MSKKVKETISIEVARMCNRLHLNGDYIPEMCELSYFIRNCMVPYSRYRDLAKLIPMVMFIWLRHHNYLIEWEEIVQYTSLPKKQFKHYLMAFYELFPFECIAEEVIEFLLEFASRTYEMVNKMRQFL